MDRPSFQEKSRLLEKRFFESIRGLPDAPQLGLKQIWKLLREEGKRLQRGTLHLEDKLLRALRGGGYSFAQDAFNHGLEVQRTIAGTGTSLQFRDVLSDVAGASMAIVASKQLGKPEQDPPFVNHLGEKLSLIRDGDIELEWVDYSPDLDVFEAKKALFDQEKTVWMKSRYPHRLRRKKAGCRELAIISDARGAHAVVRSSGLRVDSFGAETIEAREISEPERMWRRLFAVGARLDSIRTRKGVSAMNLAQLTATHTSHISRLESGAVSPDFEEIIRMASALDEPVAELCPIDFDRSLIRGCFVWPKAEIDAYLPGLNWSVFPTQESQRKNTPILPVLWRATGLLGSLCSSPTAQSLVGVHIYLGRWQRRQGELQSYQSAIGRWNDERIAERIAPGSDRQWGGFCSSVAETAIFCMDGNATVEIERWPEARLFPALAAQTRGPALVDTVHLTKDSLLYIRPRYGFRITRSGENLCNLLCLLSMRWGASGLVELPDKGTLAVVHDYVHSPKNTGKHRK